jgi:hypothetical protein
MPFLKGNEVNGYTQIDRNVRFLKDTAFSYSMPWSKSWFVDGSDGSDDYDGGSPGRAKATIDAAVQLAGHGDVIYIRPKTYIPGTGFGRYDETATVDVAQYNLSLVGVTRSLNTEFGARWAMTTAATYAILGDGPAMHVENIGFFLEGCTTGGCANLRNNGATYTQIGSTGTTFYNCVIKGGLIKLAGGDGFTARECKFHAMYDGTYGGGIAMTCSTIPGRRFTVRNCVFQGGNAVAPANTYISTSSGTCTEILIADNKFGPIPADGHYVNLTTGSSGLFTGNSFEHANIVLETSLHLGEVVQSNNWDTAGIVV